MNQPTKNPKGISPKPWTAKPTEYYEREGNKTISLSASVQGPEGTIAVMHFEPGVSTIAQMDANANLFAAAPLLYAAVDAADTAFAVFNINLDHTPQARSAVREAWPLIQQARAAVNPDGNYAICIKDAQDHEIKRLDGIIANMTQRIADLEAAAKERILAIREYLSVPSVTALRCGLADDRLAELVGLKEDGTCTGDEKKCCGNCGDRPPGWKPEPPAKYTGPMDPDCYYAKSCGFDPGSCPVCKDRRQTPADGIYYGDEIGQTAPEEKED